MDQNADPTREPAATSRLSSSSPRQFLTRALPAARIEALTLQATRRLLRAAELLCRLQSRALPSRLQVSRDLPYRGSRKRAHLLDIYRLRAHAPEDGPRPVVMYIHGGAFEACSKDTHMLLAQRYARAGYVVANVNYKLAPEHPFPEGLRDVCEAYRWLLDNASRFGGDPTRLILAGESAGANLALGLMLTTCVERPEPWARAVFRSGQQPIAVLPACGVLQVSELERMRTGRPRDFVTRGMCQMERAYLPTEPRWEGEHALADPLCILESDAVIQRALPPIFAFAGGLDPLADDTVRLGAALQRRRARHEMCVYPDEIHAFHAMMWRSNARDAWQRGFRFIDRILAELDAEEQARLPCAA